MEIVVAAGIGRNAGAFVRGNLVLVNDPLEGRAIAEAVAEGVEWGAGEGE